VSGVPIVINGVEHVAHRLDLDYTTGHMVIDVDLLGLLGKTITFRVHRGDSCYSGSGIVTGHHAAKDQPIETEVRLDRPLVKELTK
jgi:hypothetical protein